MRRFIGRRLFLGAMAAVSMMALMAGVGQSSPASAATITYNSRTVSVNPERAPAGKKAGHVFSCQVAQSSSPVVCYSPEQIQRAYNIAPLLGAGVDGAGVTIVIIDAYQNPGMAQDLATFDTTFGLPAPNFEQIAPDGLTPFNPNDANQVGWSAEIALDVQWAHAVAPGANIKLVLAKSSQDQDLLSVTQYVVRHHLGDIISQSYGENESCVDPNLLAAEHSTFAEATREHMTLFAASGDQGAAQVTCDGTSWTRAVSSPASDPLVAAVGGTELLAAPVCQDANHNEIPCANGTPPGAYEGESALNEPAGSFSQGSLSTGGGYSVLYHQPFYQSGVVYGTEQRGVPDVAYDGAVGHGVLASWTIGGGFYVFGGTSAGTPQWAGITALADQRAGESLGFITPALYAIAHAHRLYRRDFHDILSGDNTVQEPNSSGKLVTVSGFSAHFRWDATTGLGSPNVARLVSLIPDYHHRGDDSRAANELSGR